MIPGGESLSAAFEDREVGGYTGPVLEAGRTYYYRVVVSNASGTVRGPVEEFTKAPVVEAEGVSGQTTTGVKLEANINPNGQTTKYIFEYSTEAGGTPLALEGAITKIPGEGPLPAEFAGLPVSTVLTGLQPGKTYYYRVVAENETTEKPGGTPTTGQVESFTTTVLDTLDLTKTGNGNGTVTSTPAGIDCGATCTGRPWTKTPK